MSYKIHIMYGLPGSGKTYYCSQNIINSNPSSPKRYLDLDYYWKKLSNTVRYKDSWLRDCLENRLYRLPENFEMYIDGLFTTYKSIANIINIICELNYIGDIIIHAWNEDRISCLKNDYKRREQSANISIKEMPFEVIEQYSDISEMIHKEGKNISISVEKHTVMVKPEWKQFYDKYGLNTYEEYLYTNYNSKADDFHKSKYLYSEWWCVGGSCSNYLGETTYISPDETPNFKELYDLFLSIDEDFPLRYATEIYNTFVEKETKCEGDYYGGNINYERYSINLIELYSYLESKSYA